MGKAYLVMADGTVFEGIGFGADAEAMGEFVFTTGVVGYIETLTNPCHAGQIVLQTFPLGGNYGVIEEDISGKCAAAGYVVREWCAAPSNFRCNYDIDSYLKKQGIPGICGVDTRAITRKIREEGVMNAMICRSIPDDLTALQNYGYSGAADKFSCTEKQTFAVDHAAYSVAMLDQGMKHGIIAELNRLGCSVTVYPFHTDAEEILSGHHDGLIIADGGGDPRENISVIAETAKLMGKVPMMGIGLGHCIMALADGGCVKKMKAGHYGSNQPVKGSDRCYITAQSHIYAVESAPNGEILYTNVNDGSCEGMNYAGKHAFSVQFVPASCIGPNSTGFIFERFISMMGGDDQCR